MWNILQNKKKDSKMKKVKISVIVPIYNVEKWLSKCINSILAQNFKDFELILINHKKYVTNF